MLIPRFALTMSLAGLMVLGAGIACGQDYPSKVIRIVTSPAGGGNDFVARLIAQGLTGPIGQSVIVDNRAAMGIAAEAVSKAPPDGYMLLAAGSSFVFGPLMQPAPYDPVTSFSPIALTGTAPNILVVHPSLPVKSVKDLIVLAKSRPGQLNYGTAGTTGSSSHLAGELFKSMAGVDIVRINYKGAGAALTDLMAGQVQMTFGTSAAVTPHVKTGRLKAVAVTSLQPSALLPGLATMSASGLPGYEVISLDALFAPAKTPAAVINRLNQEIGRVVTRADVKEKLFNAGVETALSSPEDLANKVKSETLKWGKVIKEAGIRAD